MTIPQNPENYTNYIEKKTTTSVTKWIYATWKPILAEFVSTMLLLILGCIGCVPIEVGIPNPAMYAPITFGLVVLFNIQIFGHISGAFMNPLVSVIAVIWGKISISVGIAFIIVQVAGALVGYGILTTLVPLDMSAEGVCLTLPRSGMSDIQALGIEFFLSSILSLVNCAVWDSVNKSMVEALPIKFGLTIAGLSLAGGHMTGASMNPVRSLGPAFWTNTWDSHWVYWVGPLVGGVIPAVIYKYVWLEKEKSDIIR